MKKNSRAAVGSLFLLIVSLMFLPSAFAMDDAGFTISRMVISADIVDREPVGVSETFPAATEMVYCFLEAKDIDQDTQVSFVWLHQGNEMAAVTLPLGQGSRWRTKSSKKLGGLTGQWQVELRDATGVILNTVAFTVE